MLGELVRPSFPPLPAPRCGADWLAGRVCSMPLLRTSLYSQGVTLYIAPTADARESWIATMQHIALEGRCFVVGCNQFVTRETLPEYVPGAVEVDMEDDDDVDGDLEAVAQGEVVCNGGSVVFDPLGNLLAGPMWGTAGVLRAEIGDVQKAVVRAKMDLDTAVGGHYSRYVHRPPTRRRWTTEEGEEEEHG